MRELVEQAGGIFEEWTPTEQVQNLRWLGIEEYDPDEYDLDMAEPVGMIKLTTHTGALMLSVDAQHVFVGNPTSIVPAQYDAGSVATARDVIGRKSERYREAREAATALADARQALRVSFVPGSRNLVLFSDVFGQPSIGAISRHPRSMRGGDSVDVRFGPCCLDWNKTCTHTPMCRARVVDTKNCIGLPEDLADYLQESDFERGSILACILYFVLSYLQNLGNSAVPTVRFLRGIADSDKLEQLRGMSEIFDGVMEAATHGTREALLERSRFAVSLLQLADK